MNKLNRELDRAGFTDREKQSLTARLARAAEQKGTVGPQNRSKSCRWSRGVAVGAAAACLMTVGVVAAALSPGFRSYFTVDTPGAPEALASSSYRLDRSQTYKGWTVTLAECVGDDNGVYIWVDVIAPEGTALAAPEDGCFRTHYTMAVPQGVYATSGGNMSALPDADPTDNRISFCIESWGDSLRGRAVSITLDPIVDTWWENPGTDQAALCEGELTADIRDHRWVFRDVTLDYPDRTIRLTPNAEVPYADGAATLTKVEVSPLSTTVRVEGGACYDHHSFKAWNDAVEEAGLGENFEGNSILLNRDGTELTIKKPPTSSSAGWFDCFDALDVQLDMADGSSMALTQTAGGVCYDGLQKARHDIPHVERVLHYMRHSSQIPPRSIDPAQVKSVTVCGVEIPVE